MHVLLPILPYLTIIALTAVMLWLLYEMNRRLHRLGKQVSRCDAALTARGSEFAHGLSELKRSMAAWGSEGETRASGDARVTGLGSALRGKVLKMHRMGQTPDRIAETLGVPKGEVDLLVKVHRIVMRPYEGVPASLGQN